MKAARLVLGPGYLVTFSLPPETIAFPAIGLSSPCSCLETPGMALH